MELDRTLVRDLQRAFRDFYRKRPSYQLLPVHEPSDPGAATGDRGPGAATDANQTPQDNAAPHRDGDDSDFDAPVGAAQLLPPGPLAGVHIRPSTVRVACNTVRTIRAYATDATQRPLEDNVECEWSLAGDVGALLEDDQGRSGCMRLHAATEEATGTITVTARHDGLSAVAEAPVEVLYNLGSAGANEGIPKPELINASGLTWRSRMQDGQWQVNTAHPDYRNIETRPAPKLRYLAMLFAKEVVQRSHQDPRLAEPLEQLVEIAAFADRNLSAKKIGRSR
jgi:hypothetical protein